MRLFLLLACLLAACFPVRIAGESAPEIMTEKVKDDKIKTVMLFREGWELSYPIMKLGSDDRLILHFDLLGDDIETYYYTFIHCDKDWIRSDIFFNDFLEGFPENPIEEYRSSFNTTVKYVHYKLTFPNDRIRLTLSGNYILSVYRAGEPDMPVITKRFIVTENIASIEMNMHRPRMTTNTDTHQQVDFTVNISSLNNLDPYRDIYSTVLQNGRWATARCNLKPEFFSNSELKYSSLSDKTIFPGGNEFRYFDIKSIRYKSEFIRNIEFLMSNYHVYLTPSENREYKPYFYQKDLNGKYLIAVQEGQNADTDADYLYVYFTLSAKEPLPGGKVYVGGAFNNWEFGAGNHMAYNAEGSAYECIILLKQGWYNYEYTFIKDSDDNDIIRGFEGNHYETENDYSVIVYYRNPRDRYDRVISTVTANSLNRLTD